MCLLVFAKGKELFNNTAQYRFIGVAAGLGSHHQEKDLYDTRQSRILPAVLNTSIVLTLFEEPLPTAMIPLAAKLIAGVHLTNASLTPSRIAACQESDFNAVMALNKRTVSQLLGTKLQPQDLKAGPCNCNARAPRT